MGTGLVGTGILIGSLSPFLLPISISLAAIGGSLTAYIAHQHKKAYEEFKKAEFFKEKTLENENRIKELEPALFVIDNNQKYESVNALLKDIEFGSEKILEKIKLAYINGKIDENISRILTKYSGSDVYEEYGRRKNWERISEEIKTALINRYENLLKQLEKEYKGRKKYADKNEKLEEIKNKMDEIKNEIKRIKDYKPYIRYVVIEKNVVNVANYLTKN